ncbi:hypothetical protein C8Q75DRAFT_334786 [Abortiporus biennis]|nr:hypothetical protein C8Q75DRAFT_334786 [Abortiporus biennis]
MSKVKHTATIMWEQFLALFLFSSIPTMMRARYQNAFSPLSSILFALRHIHRTLLMHQNHAFTVVCISPHSDSDKNFSPAFYVSISTRYPLSPPDCAPTPPAPQPFTTKMYH